MSLDTERGRKRRGWGATEADGKCSPEPGKPLTDAGERRSGSSQARDPPGSGARSHTDPGAPGKLQSPSPANSSDPGATVAALPAGPGALPPRYRRTRRLKPEDGAGAQRTADAASRVGQRRSLFWETQSLDTEAPLGRKAGSRDVSGWAGPGCTRVMEGLAGFEGECSRPRVAAGGSARQVRGVWYDRVFGGECGVCRVWCGPVVGWDWDLATLGTRSCVHQRFRRAATLPGLEGEKILK